MVGALAHGVARAEVLVRRAGIRDRELARAADQLAGNQERQQLLAEALQGNIAADQVVLVAAIRVAQGVRVVLQQVDLAADGLLGAVGQLVKQQVARAVVGDQLVQAIAFCSSELRVRADVQVEARGALGVDIRAAVLFHHGGEELAGNLVGTEAPGGILHVGDSILGFQAHDAAADGGHWPPFCT